MESATQLEIIDSPPASSAVLVARSAAILSLGNVLSRVLGLARELVIADLFGATGLVSVLRVALIVPTMIYDLLVGGLIGAALVPVFGDYAEGNKPEVLWRIASGVILLTAAALGIIVLLFEIFAPQLAWALGSGYDESLQQAATDLIRIVLPSTIFLGLSGILAAVLYALKRFRYPAFTAALFNLSVVVCALILSHWFGIASVVIGVLIGALGQLVLQAAGLTDFHLRVALDWNDPALRRIFKLYSPVLAGLIISNLQIGLDRNLASHTGEQSVAWMQNATTLIQLPLGLVVSAISLAVLPTLSQARGDFQTTLVLGLNWVVLMILPATFFLFVLAEPVVALLFQHGAFTPNDTLWTSIALRLYLIGLPFAAIDQPLVFAFYARKDTLTPALVGVVSTVIYLVVALALIERWGMVGLVLANAAQLSGHAVIMIALARTRLGGLRVRSMMRSVLKVMLAGIIMALVAAWVHRELAGILSVPGVLGEFVLLGLPLASSLLIYIAALKILRVREMEQLWGMIVGRVVK